MKKSSKKLLLSFSLLGIIMAAPLVMTFSFDNKNLNESNNLLEINKENIAVEEGVPTPTGCEELIVAKRFSLDEKLDLLFTTCLKTTGEKGIRFHQKYIGLQTKKGFEESDIKNIVGIVFFANSPWTFNDTSSRILSMELDRGFKSRVEDPTNADRYITNSIEFDLKSLNNQFVKESGEGYMRVQEGIAKGGIPELNSLNSYLFTSKWNTHQIKYNYKDSVEPTIVEQVLNKKIGYIDITKDTLIANNKINIAPIRIPDIDLNIFIIDAEIILSNFSPNWEDIFKSIDPNFDVGDEADETSWDKIKVRIDFYPYNTQSKSMVKNLAFGIDFHLGELLEQPENATTLPIEASITDKKLKFLVIHDIKPFLDSIFANNRARHDEIKSNLENLNIDWFSQIDISYNDPDDPKKTHYLFSSISDSWYQNDFFNRSSARSEILIKYQQKQLEFHAFSRFVDIEKDSNDNYNTSLNIRLHIDEGSGIVKKDIGVRTDQTYHIEKYPLDDIKKLKEIELDYQIQTTSINIDLNKQIDDKIKVVILEPVRNYSLAIGLSVGIPLILIVIGLGIFIYRKTRISFF